MCGRYGIEETIIKQVEEDFNIHFDFKAESNICPSMLIPTIIANYQGYQQLNGTWGIQPSWSKKLLINAQSETAEIKPTFKHSFHHYRCIIPMAYWFEWCKKEGHAKKVKYQFSPRDDKPLYMAGIFYPKTDGENQIVSLTTAPTKQCIEYHYRMPLLVDKNWLVSGSFAQNSDIIFNIKDQNPMLETNRTPQLF